MSATVQLTGATRLYAIVGDPVAQVRSPEVFTARFAADGIDAVLIPVHVPAADFDAIAPALLAIGNVDGVLVTIPFKARIVPHATRLGPAAQCIGAANALRREADGTWTGEMFDGVGFVRGAQHKGERLHGRRVVLFGAGGAGSAIAYALADAGVQSILDAFKIIIVEQRALLDLSSDAGDEGTNALMSDYIRQQEKLVWMYSSFLKK